MSAPSGSGNHALQDYQMQLMLLEQQNKMRLRLARQEQDRMSQARNDRSLLEPRVFTRRQSDLCHGLLTPRASPTYRGLLAPSNCPSPQASMSNAPALDPNLTGQIYDAPYYLPSTGVGPPLLHRQIQYSASTYTSRPCNPTAYQEYQYPQNPQAKQSPTANVLGSDAFTPVPLIPVCANLEPNVVSPYDQWVESMVSDVRMQSVQSVQSMDSDVSMESVQSMQSMPLMDEDLSMRSLQSIQSTDSSKTYDTVDLEVLTPRSQWDELPGLKDFSGCEPQCKVLPDLASNFVDLYPPPDFAEHSWMSCNETVRSSPNTTNEDLCLSATISNKFNLNSQRSRVATDRNLDTNTKLYPVEPAKTPPKKASRSSGLSNVLQGHEQGGNLSKSMANENGTELQDYQIPVSPNLGFASKHHVNEDTLISIEASPLPCAANSVINTVPGQDLTYDPSPFSRWGSETCSWFSDNETDWGDDESDDAHRTIGTLAIEGSNISGEQELPNLISRPVLSKMKQELVDRIMMEFWQIFNQDKEINIYEDTSPRSPPLQQRQEQDTSHGDQQSTAPASKSTMKLDVQVNGTRLTGGQNGKRKRHSQDEDENDENEKRNPKRPKGLLSPPRNQDDTSKFACPYRKHDAKKYCVKHWRSCALTPLETVARVKGHLYRHHRIFPCQRCKSLFNDQQGVNDHLMEPKGCKLLEVVRQDGITNEMVEKLRSKKKAHRDQSEEDRWREIYQILFPGEMVPSPFFEEIQEDMIQSPDSQELADYEEYCRRELPRVFRASLEEVVNNKTQPLEEQLRSQLMDLIRDAQDRVFSRYRSSSTTTGTPARGAPSSSPQANTSSYSSQCFATSPLGSQPTTVASSGDRSQARLPPFFQPPSPKNHLESGLDIYDPNITPSKPDRNDRSDSGYESSSFVMSSTQPLIHGKSSVNTSASSSQTLPLPEESQETTGHTDSEAALTQEKLVSNAGTITSAENDHLNSEPYLSQGSFNFELDYADLSNFDTNDEFRNYDFSQDLDDLF